jgi:NADH dehydrogenase
MTVDMRTVLVTGASGFVGSHTLPRLLEAGYEAVCLVRGEEARQEVLRRLPAEKRHALRFVHGDVTEPDSLAPALAGVDAVFHLVAIIRDRSGGRDLERVNLGGTRNVLDAMRSTAVRRLVYLNNLGVVEDPELKFATSKARAERAVAESGLEWTTLKPSVMWGERDGFFNIIAGLARISPVVPLLGRGRMRFQPLWIGDLASIVVRCLDDPATAGRTYELGGPRHWTYLEIVREVLRGMSARRILVPVPVPLVLAASRAAELVHLPFPSTPDQVRQLRLDNTTSPTAVQDAFGFEPRPMEGGLGYLRERPADQ